MEIYSSRKKKVVLKMKNKFFYMLLLLLVLSLYLLSVFIVGLFYEEEKTVITIDCGYYKENITENKTLYCNEQYIYLNDILSKNIKYDFILT